MVLAEPGPWTIHKQALRACLLQLAHGMAGRGHCAVCAWNRVDGFMFVLRELLPAPWQLHCQVLHPAKQPIACARMQWACVRLQAEDHIPPSQQHALACQEQGTPL